MNKIIILLSILIGVVGYRNAECDKCRHEAVLFGLLFLLFINHGTLGIRFLILFLIGEFLIEQHDKHRR